MAMGKRRRERQGEIWLPAAAIALVPGHPFYERLNALLGPQDFGGFVEGECRAFYAERLGRPSLPPAIYFRLLPVGYFEGIDSERGIAWRLADSLSLRAFCGYALTETTPDHSTLSRNRRLIAVETHQAVFAWELKRLAEAGLVRGGAIGIDATTLEANAALRSLVRRDTGEGYTEYLQGLAAASGIRTPTRAALARLDRRRKGKASNDDWQNPHDPDARITKLKDGRTHLAHKAEHAVDLETEAVLAVTLQPGDRGDSASLPETLGQTLEHPAMLAQDEGSPVSAHLVARLVMDKGYHSNATVMLTEALGIRSCCSEPARGRRHWTGQVAAQRAVHANRRRIRGERGKQLLHKRGEYLERPFAHCYETGGLRRLHLRGLENALKRQLIHVAGFNLGLLLRRLLGSGKPRTAGGRAAALRVSLDRRRSTANAHSRLYPLLNRLRLPARNSAPLRPIAGWSCCRPFSATGC
ncbi:transposase [bacterium]|nr:transposase [bacterium]